MNFEIRNWFYLTSFLAAIAITLSAENNVTFYVCPTSTPNYNECMKNSLQNVIPQLKNGYRKYRIPPLEPFYLPKLEVKQGGGPVSLDLTFQKMRIYGLTGSEIQAVRINPVNLTDGFLKILLKRPVSLVGSYLAKGKVQVFPINGKGFCNITLVNSVIEVYNLTAESVERKGIKYLNVTNIQAKTAQIEKVILRMDNLFQGNKEISDNLNSVLNENWSLIYDEIKPALDETIAAIIKDIADYLLLKVPQDQIFPK